MYRNILCMTALVMVLFMGTALAAPRAMTVDDAVIAGIAPGSALSYVRSIYGEPDGEKTKRTGNYPTHLVDYYGEGFVITYDIFGGAQNPLIQSIESTNAALVMPSGIHVGMKIAEVQQIFSDIQAFSSGRKEQSVYFTEVLCGGLRRKKGHTDSCF